MKMLYVVALALVAACAAETYDTKNDNYDINAKSADPQELLKLVNCFLDKEPCSPIAADFKKYMPEAIQQACAKCTKAQKYIIKTFFNALEIKLPADFKAIVHKYDPDNVYFAPFIAAAENSEGA